MLEDIEVMTIITMMKEEDHLRVPEATNVIEVAKIIIIIIEDGTTVTHIQIRQKDRRYKSRYQKPLSETKFHLHTQWFHTLCTETYQETQTWNRSDWPSGRHRKNPKFEQKFDR